MHQLNRLLGEVRGETFGGKPEKVSILEVLAALGAVLNRFWALDFGWISNRVWGLDFESVLDRLQGV